jgi:DNA polymerase-3 subunit beta
VLIEAAKDHVTLTTTNLDLGIRVKIKAEAKETGAVTLPVKRLATIVRELPNVDVMVDSTASHQVKLASGGSTFRIMGIGKEEFPPLPEFGDEKSFTLNQDELTAMLRSVDYAQSTDETRYILNGVYFNFRDEKLSLVATDGRRLALVSKELEVPAASAGSIILPAKTVAELARMLGKGSKLKVSFNDRRASFQIATDKDSSGLMDHVYLYSKVVEGNYPNYQQVIPKETHQRLKLERELFLQCVHRAQLVCSEKANSVKIKLTTNLLEITAQSPDFGEAHESMAVAYSGAEMQVAFNPAYLLDPLRALTKDEVFLELKDEVSPGVFKTLENFVCVIMPVRLS